MLKKLPIDTYTFRKIRENDYAYVDKTNIIYQMTHEMSIAFLSRPRRFGKSMLCHTLKQYFSGNKQLFEGLKIFGLEKDWTKHPVFFFTMSPLKDCSLEVMREKLSVQLRNVYVLEIKLDSTPEDALKQIDEKDYSIPYENRTNGRAVVKCGVNISSKLRTIDGWTIC